MATQRTRARSSAPHQFPTFYACYLLKSIRTPRSVQTYIGSTPSPPRRIRQHNGEITQGAWKTKNNRPWIMQMLVYGFPSKLAALQFEWAWQHPHISRHLRGDDGKSVFNGDQRSRYIKMNIRVARTMISCRPYNIWPLQVKLFTGEAVKIWNSVCEDDSIPPLPLGFVYQTELEGVDGKSGVQGSGRVGPIDISDDTFTSAHLTKHNALLASGRRLTCSICAAHLDNYATDALSVALCSTAGCTAVSHLKCLSDHFLSSHVGDATIVPRGGQCTSCKNYTLWGDIIKGSFRRHAGKAIPAPDENDDEDEDGEVFGDGEEDESVLPPTISPAKKRPKVARKTKVAGPSVSQTPGELVNVPRPKTGRPRTKALGTVKRSYHTAVPQPDSAEEFFDLNAISGDDEVEDAPPPPVANVGRATVASRAVPSGSPRAPLYKCQPLTETDRHFYSRPAISTDDEMRDAAPANLPSIQQTPSGPSAGPSRTHGAKRKASMSPATVLRDSGEFFDLNVISADSEDDAVPPAPSLRGPSRRRRRPPKPSHAKERPNFDIFHPNKVADLVTRPSSSRPPLPSGSSSSESNLEFPFLPPGPSVPAVPMPKPKRPILLEGEVDFFDDSDDSSSGYPKLASARADVPDIADAMSTLSVSSPAPSPSPKRAMHPRSAVQVIDISD